MQVTILISIFIKSHDGLLSVANLTLNANHVFSLERELNLLQPSLLRVPHTPFCIPSVDWEVLAARNTKVIC